MTTDIAILIGAAIIAVGLGVGIWISSRGKESRWVRLRSIGPIVGTGCATLGGSGLAKAHDTNFPFDTVITYVGLICLVPIVGFLILEAYVTYREPSDRWVENLEYIIEHHYGNGKKARVVAAELGVSVQYVAGIIYVISDIKSRPELNE
jgi:hypothetical protein